MRIAIPGRIDNPQSRGCHKLIKDGAKLVESFDDIYQEFSNLPLFDLPKVREEKSEKKLESDLLYHLNLTDLEQKILNFVKCSESTVDSIIEEVKEPAGKVFATLLTMESKRLVKPLPGKRYTALLR